MDKLQSMRVFMQVVQSNGFGKAAESMGMPPATVTLAVQRLESQLKVQLLNRSTRRMSLTSDGAAYFDLCVRLLAELDDAEAAFKNLSRVPRGRLRIEVSPSIAYRIVIPQLHEFKTLYPNIELVIGVGDRPVDLVQEAVDCAVRVGELADSSLVAKRIGFFDFVICGAPSYFERHPQPKNAQDLEQHCLVKYFSSRTGRLSDWEFRENGVDITIKSRDCIAVNDADAYLGCGLHGLGLIKTARFMTQPHIESGELIEVLATLERPVYPISVVYPTNRHLSPKVRTFVDWVTATFEKSPLLHMSDK
jgi:LysR family transcriptional regulator for bpeEF and oprC